MPKKKVLHASLHQTQTHVFLGGQETALATWDLHVPQVDPSLPGVAGNRPRRGVKAPSFEALFGVSRLEGLVFPWGQDSLRAVQSSMDYKEKCCVQSRSTTRSGRSKYILSMAQHFQDTSDHQRWLLTFLDFVPKKDPVRKAQPVKKHASVLKVLHSIIMYFFNKWGDAKQTNWTWYSNALMRSRIRVLWV